jgi:lactate dehydrogenase-like 2-hydroxyacid dehydrogenase
MIWFNMMNFSLPTVLVTHTLPLVWVDLLQDHCRLIFGPPDANEISPDLEANLWEAEGIFSLLTIRITAETLAKAPNLKVISNMAVGFDNIDVTACTRRGIPVGHTPGVLTDGTADLTMAILLAAARRLLEANSDARQGRWTTWSPTGWLGADFRDANLGIIGMGKIGKAVAKRAQGFGMRIAYCDSIRQPEIDKDLEAKWLDLDTLLRKSDFVSLHVPLTSDTYHLIDAESLRKMKKTALLINTSRGAVVDTQALVQALQENWIGGAALDVTDPEPLPADHPLFTINNCLVVPHIGSATWNTRRRMAELACENLLAGLQGKRLPYTANPEVYKD